MVYGSLDDDVEAVVGSGVGASDGAAVGAAVWGVALGDPGVTVKLGVVGSAVICIPEGLKVGLGVEAAVGVGLVGLFPDEHLVNQRAEVDEGLPAIQRTKSHRCRRKKDLDFGDIILKQDIVVKSYL